MADNDDLEEKSEEVTKIAFSQYPEIKSFIICDLQCKYISKQRNTTYNLIRVNLSTITNGFCSIGGAHCDVLGEKKENKCVCQKYVTEATMNCEYPKGLLFEDLEICEKETVGYTGTCTRMDDFYDLACFRPKT